MVILVSSKHLDLVNREFFGESTRPRTEDTFRQETATDFIQVFFNVLNAGITHFECLDKKID